jgi:hypothetical protein
MNTRRHRLGCARFAVAVSAIGLFLVVTPSVAFASPPVVSAGGTANFSGGGSPVALDPDAHRERFDELDPIERDSCPSPRAT